MQQSSEIQESVTENNFFTRSRQALKKLLFPSHSRWDTNPHQREQTPQAKINRRQFLQSAAAVGTATVATLMMPSVAQSKTEKDFTQDKVSVDGNSNQDEQDHSDKNWVRALYEKTAEEFNYPRFLYAVSLDFPLPNDFPKDSAEISLVSIDTLGINGVEGTQVAEVMQPYLAQLFSDAEAAGFTPHLTSGFRSINYQAQLFIRYMSAEMKNNNLNKDQAFQKVLMYAAFPGASEHHLGLAIDVVAYKGQKWDEARATYDQGFYQWIREHAHEYGFVISYPTGTQASMAKKSAAIDSAEPWHLRFVGREVAEYFKESDYLNPHTAASVHSLLSDPYLESQ